MAPGPLAWTLVGVLALLIVAELAAFGLVRWLRPGFPWLITRREDEVPKLDPAGLSKFLSDGFDAELGWVRRPNTTHAEKGKTGPTRWHTDADGARANPAHAGLPRVVTVYGDSFSFSRQVNDDETWPVRLSALTKTDVKNFGVGNYGLDQALLRLRREHPRHATPIVVVGVVPDTISRILSAWKHYYEYGNTFGFKPRFRVVDGALRLEPSPVRSREDYDRLDAILPDVRRRDFFHARKFQREIMRFPFLFSILRRPGRNLPLLYHLLRREAIKRRRAPTPAEDWAPMGVIMKVNLEWRLRLFREKEPVELLAALAKALAEEGRNHGFRPVLAFLPQKDDVNEVRARGHFYAHAAKACAAHLDVVDLMDDLVGRADLDDLYCDDNWYGGHYSPAGNALVAERIAAWLAHQGDKGAELARAARGRTA